jgi:PEP-CTERM motif
MRSSTIGAWVIAAFLVAALAGGAKAGSLALMNTGGTPTEGAAASMGFAFTTNQSITVDALADVIVPSQLSSTQVRLYNGAGTILAEATVSTSDPHPYSIPYKPGESLSLYVHAITPVTLAANTTYYIVADVPNSTSFISQLTGITTDPSITYDQGVYALGTGNNPLTASGSGPLPPGYLGPDFIIGASAVPEPSSLVLAGLAVAGVTISLTRRRKPRRA